MVPQTTQEVEEYRKLDPIEQVRKTILDNKLATEADLTAIEDNIKATVAESVDFAENSAFPDPSQAYEDVYEEMDYPFITD